MSEFLNKLINNAYVINMIILSLSGFFIRTSLVISGQKWANTYHHLLTYIFLPVTGYLITNIIKGDLALSLGMIGALSIVRFRNPVKNPFELVIFFSLLTLGIIASVSTNILILFLSFMIVVIFGVKISDKILNMFNISLFQSSFDDGNEIFMIDIELKNKLENIQQYSNLIYFNYDIKDKIYHYKFSFKSKSDLLKQKEIFLQDKNIYNMRADLQR